MVESSAPRLAEIGCCSDGDGCWRWCGVIQGPEPAGHLPAAGRSYRKILAGNHPAPGKTFVSQGFRPRLDAAAVAAQILAHEQNGKNEQNPDGLRLLRLRSGHRPGLRGRRPRLRPDPRRERHRPGLRRRRRWHDGRDRQCRARPRRHGDRHHPRVPGGARARQQALPEPDRHPRHARAQTQDVRDGRRLRRPARRGRHPGGTGRATDLGAARPPQEAGAARQYRAASGSRFAR